MLTSLKMNLAKTLPLASTKGLRSVSFPPWNINIDGRDFDQDE